MITTLHAFHDFKLGKLLPNSSHWSVFKIRAQRDTRSILQSWVKLALDSEDPSPYNRNVGVKFYRSHTQNGSVLTTIGENESTQEDENNRGGEFAKANEDYLRLLRSSFLLTIEVVGISFLI